ncbi:nitroreductase [Zavarzinia compransoris]|uniref:Nitroreductase family protein n=1 Tax=Zavarzinia compransoris TaxID=1264899 RepID=A0A317DSS9_9PROT|nr:nitroreductase [Zavarzinia compransoris]PWR17721.1 nitroreductase family protein [Zavarzinia compransoris]TDP49244.1 nitroreductase [Zavarzinia compransoris]
MKVSEALDSRLSVRAFLPAPVPVATIRAILEGAKRSPSGGNLQPWHVHVVTGAALDEVKAIIKARLADSTAGEGTEYQIYPPNLTEPYRTRRFRVGEQLYEAIGIARDNKFGRLMQFARNFEFFGAPAALFFSIDRQMQPGQWADLGMFMQSVMLLAREHGLDTCAQEAWAIWHKTLGTHLKLPDTLMLFAGISLGYRDDGNPINHFRSERAPLEDFTTFLGD